MNRKLGWWFSGFIIVMCVRAISQDVPRSDNSVNSLFQKGNHEAGVSTALLYSPILPDKGRPTINYTLSGAHFGWMLTDVNQSWLPGNVELLGEAIGGTAFHGTGNYLVGGTAWVRYNFVEPNWRLVPYLQGGVGTELTDFDQRLIGEHFNFNLNLGAGMHWFVVRNVSIDIGCHFQHLSNARLSHTDIGVNAFGPELGVSYFF